VRIIEASAVIESFTPNLEKNIEAAGRTCWKSEDKIGENSACEFIEKIKGYNHASVLEHGAITVRFVIDRGVSHELVRHRIASFSQESTRYCNYTKGKFDSEITVIKPCFWPEGSYEYSVWALACKNAEIDYFKLIQYGAKAQEARSVLPNSLKTELVMTANPREFMHIFELRCAPAAHPQMREVMIPLLHEFAYKWPSIFGDLAKKYPLTYQVSLFANNKKDTL
jgi:thymidylate synthase (FAD)